VGRQPDPGGRPARRDWRPQRVLRAGHGNL